MKKIILLFGIVLCGCGACSENKNNNKPTFNPTTQETVVTNKISNISKTVSPINGNIALSVIVQNNLPSESAELLKSKIIYSDRRNIQFNKQNAYRSRRFKGISYNECHFFYLYK